MRALLLLTLGACSDQDFVPEADDRSPDGRPEIQVSPERLDFEGTLPGAVASQWLTVTNAGNGDLLLNDLQRTGTTAFEVDTLALTRLIPGESMELEVRFSPQSMQEEGALFLYNNDPHAPVVEVPLSGLGLMPALSITPESLDFGQMVQSCLATQTLTLENVGNAPLTLSQLLVTGPGFVLLEPWTAAQILQPGEQLPVDVDFSLPEPSEAEGALYVTHDGVSGPDHAMLWAESEPMVTASDRYLQGPFGQQDILIWIDRSGSMDDDRVTLSSNISTFTDALVDLEVDWQLATVTADSGCQNSGLLTADSADLYSAVASGLGSAGGSLTESGLSVVSNALDSLDVGECNEGLLREGSVMVLILISDEPEQSYSSWSSLVADMQDQVEHLLIHSIAGPVPGGCATADPGTGYYEASVATKGAFMSICDDWGGSLADLALASTGERLDRFPLDSQPDGFWAELHVNDLVQSQGWTLDLDTAELVFEPGWVPPAGARIEVAYSTGNSCEG